MFVPETIFIERAVLDAPMVRRCRERAPDVPVVEIDDRRQLLGEADFAVAKRQLVLAPRRRAFLEHCPAGTRGMVCCNYLVMHFASNCPMDCQYCFLQEYLAANAPLTAFVNPEAGLAEIGAMLDAHPERQFRIGTGELADSLALDPLTGLSRELVPFFARRPNGLLELKTKTTAIDDLLDFDPRDRVVVSWSLAPEAVVATAERGTAPIASRLDAMRRVAQAGYKVGVHLDPLVEYDGWEEGYRALITAVAAVVPRDRIAWATMGALRFSPALRTRIRERFGPVPLLAGEHVAGGDGKWRDFQPLRVHMYRRIRSWLTDAFAGVPLLLCMETPLVWEKVFGQTPPREQQLGATLAAR